MTERAKLDALDIIQMMLNKAGIKQENGTRVNFDIIRLEKLPKSKYNLAKISTKVIGFKLDSKSYLLEPKGIMKCDDSEDEIHFDVKEAILMPSELGKIRATIQKIYNERVIILSKTYVSIKDELSEEDDRLMTTYLETIIGDYGYLFK